MADDQSKEEQKKAVLPFMQRAQEIQQADQKVAYYCRLYAVEQALKFTQRTKEINGLLVATLNQLEKDKAKLTLNPEEDRMYCEGFALKVFANADKVDRAGRATENTSKAYYAASIFIEILNQFAPVDSDLLEKQRYAAWRAAEIRKAIREGRPPLPPPAADGAPGGPPGAPGGGNMVSTPSGMVNLNDLPAAGSAQDWGQGPTPPAPPSSSFSYPSASGGSASAPPPMPTYTSMPSMTSGGSSSSGALPPAARLPGWSAPRFRPGTKVLCRDPVNGDVQHATVGQVLEQPAGQHSYKVGNRDRLLEMRDDQLVLDVTEGQPVTWMRAPQVAVPAMVVLINDSDWPPTYLVEASDGQFAAQYLQLGDPAIASSSAPAAPAAPPPPGGHGMWHPPPPHNPPPPPAHAAPPPPPTAPYGAQPHAPPGPPAAPAYAAPQAPMAYPGAAPQPAVPAIPAAVPDFKPSLQAITDAQKNAKYAVSALSFEDVTTAIKNLTDALRCLTQPEQHRRR